MKGRRIRSISRNTLRRSTGTIRAAPMTRAPEIETAAPATDDPFQPTGGTIGDDEQTFGVNQQVPHARTRRVHDNAELVIAQSELADYW